MERVTIGHHILFCGDARDVLSADIPSPLHAVVTDPPYGVELGTKKQRGKKPAGYMGFDDSPEYVRDVVVPIISAYIGRVRSAAVMPGIFNMWHYPQPQDVGDWFNPAGNGVGRWGFQCVNPILFYGKDPRQGLGISPSSPVKVGGKRDKSIDHPCPKPLGIMKWLVNKASLEGETVCDPFMGSGTTGVACHLMGRRFIGVELNRRYFDEACVRMERAIAQGDLFFSRMSEVA